MLRPEYFYGKSDKAIKYYQDLEDFLLNRIAEFMLTSEQIGGTADRYLQILQHMGLSNDEIVKQLSITTKKSTREVKEVLQDSVLTSFSNDKDVLARVLGENINPLKTSSVLSAINAEWMKTQGDLDNLTRTTINKAQVDLINMLNEVDMYVASGAMSYQEATCNVLDRYAQKGMMVEYMSGATRSLESAVRTCVVTSMNQTAAQVTNQYIVEGGIEYVMVSAHYGARHSKKGGLYSHDEWQGKGYKIEGSAPGYPNLTESTGYSINPKTGEGTVVNPAGLHGINCRHSHQPWFPDMENPWIGKDGKPLVDIKESQKVYEKQQEQRAMERSIRQTKRQLNMKQAEIDNIAETDVKSVLQQDYDRIAYKLREQNKAYNAFCAENNLARQSDRLKVGGFTAKDSAKANGRAKAYEKYKGIPADWAATQNNGYNTKLNEINPNGSRTNCASCAVAYEMSQRHLNIIARDKGNEILMQKPWKAWNDIEPIENYKKSDIIELIKKEKGNRRYELAFDHQFGKHCVILEKYEDSILLVDAQNALRVPPEEYYLEMNEIKFWRVDNAEISKVGVESCQIQK